jgi:peptidoglycan/LPS O-acetylase OafA/YrhL
MPTTEPVQQTNLMPIVVRSTSRLAGLDGLRGLAILMVLVHHLTVFDQTTGLPAQLGTLAEFCSHGVDLFFVLSGYLILDRLRAESNAPGWLGRFWVKRAAKIVPTYFASVAFVFLLLPISLHAVGAETKLATQMAAHGNWPWYATFTSNFLNALDGRFTNPALDVCWSLGIEVQFYLLAAFWVFFRGIPKPATLALGIIIAISTRVAAQLYGADWITILVLPCCRLDAFAFGAVIALGYWGWINGYIGRIIAIATLSAPFIFPWSRETWWVQTAGYTAVAVTCAFFVRVAANAPVGSYSGIFFGGKWLRFCGTISYSVYLTHLPLRAALRDIVLPRIVRPITGPSVLLQQTVFLLVGATVCLAVGWAVWRFFEEPLRRRVLTSSLLSRPAASLSA